MTESISEADFSAAAGVEDWRALYWGAKAYFRTGDFATGASFVAEIARHAAELQHDPLVDLRDDNVAVQVVTPGVGISELDLELDDLHGDVVVAQIHQRIVLQFGGMIRWWISATTTSPCRSSRPGWESVNWISSLT